MSFTTVYTRTRKPRGSKAAFKYACRYTTKTLTPMHARIRSRYPTAQTWENPDRVILNFAPGFPLVTPIVIGGKLIAGVHA